MIKTGLIGKGYWGKIIGDKLDILSDKRFVQGKSNYDPEEFKKAEWIFIATPASTHFKIAKEAIEKGVNVFIEKPFCSNANQARQLIALAKKNRVHICVDNVFLYRTELLGLIPGQYKNLKFTWHKNGPFNDTLFNDLLYHDLYLLIFLIGFKKISNVFVFQNEKDIFLFTFFYGESKIIIDYNRTAEGIKEKTIHADGIFIKFSGTIEEDPLKKVISDCLNKEIDFELNNQINLLAMELYDILYSEIKFKNNQ
jgi:predicted dehydrogenase